MESPSDYNGPVFALADDYPSEIPALHPDVQEILQIDFINNPLDYVMAVRDHIFKGNIRGGDVSRDFVLQENSEGIDWYHMPWQHWGSTGREG